MYEAYQDLLLIHLKQFFNNSGLPVSSINGKLMSRNALKKIVAEDNQRYAHLEEIENLIVVRVVMFFNDDIDTAIDMLRKEFKMDLSTIHDGDDLDPFGINMHRFTITLLPELHDRLEYQKFASIKVQLELRSVLQHSWSEVKEFFDLRIRDVTPSGRHASKLAQISYLLKTADDELVRIKEMIMREGSVVGIESGKPSEPVAKVSEPVARVLEPVAKVSEPVARAVVVPDVPDRPGFAVSLPVDEQKQAQFMRSIEHFILDDQAVRSLDRAIADHYETKLVFKDHFVDALAGLFLRIAIDHEDRIREELVARKSIILSIMQHVFKDPTQESVDYICKGSALLVLYYALLAETGDIAIIKKNLKDQAALKGMTPEAFAMDLLSYYKKALKKDFE
ncbi:MAG: hypothetical protein HQL81_00885 [Magnetococcales bacterium]|nr:hypothetical protein [Magnetococcales bacterium]